MPTLLQLKDERADLLEQCRAIQDRNPSKAVDAWSDGDRDEFTAKMTVVSTKQKEYETLEKASNSYSRFQALEQAQNEPDKPKTRPQILGSDGASYSWDGGNRRVNRVYVKNGASPVSTEEYLKAYKSAMIYGNNSGLEGIVGAQNASSGMSSDNEERGGYFILPEQWATDIIRQVDDSVYIQKMSRVIMLSGAKSLGARVRRARASTFAWQGENTDITPLYDTSLLYGKRLLTPHYLNGSTVISRDLLRNVPNSESMVMGEIGIDLTYKLEPAFTSGDGNMKPMGLMTASTDGISTGRDVTSAATAFTFDDFVNIKYQLKLRYRSQATWLLHRLILNQTALLKDGQGRYLWEPNRTVGSPDTILGNSLQETEWMPNAVTSGMYYALLGDFSHYWIVYEVNMDMQRLVETRAKTNEVEYYFRCKLDAQPMLEEAFVRGKRA